MNNANKNQGFSKTKIVWSLENNQLTENLARLVATAEINMVILSFSPEHADHIKHFVQEVHAERPPELGRVSIMLNVDNRPRADIANVSCGPQVEYGNMITLVPEGEKGDLEVRSRSWDKLFAENAKIFLGFGNVVLKTKKIYKNKIEAEVIQGGTINVGTDIHIPDTKAIPTAQDISPLKVEELRDFGVDFVLLPGISSKSEIERVRSSFGIIGKDAPWLILRIDNRLAYESLTELLPVVNGVMISRRELALTLQPSIVPMVSKEIIFNCNESVKLVLVESEMLSSMRYNPTPTRAEVSDVANAIYDGTDAVVISEEIAKGHFPGRALRVCSNIIKDIETRTTIDFNWQRKDLKITAEIDAVSFHAIKTAERVRAKAIVCITKEGHTALRLASFRVQTPIIAVTFSEGVQRKLSAVRGVDTIVLNTDPNLDEVLPVVSERLKKTGWVASGDRIVLVSLSISSIGYEASNLFTVQKIE